MQDTGGAALESRKNSAIALSVAAAAILAADQITKILAVALLRSGREISLIPGVLDLRLTLNPGGIFGLFRGASTLLLVLTAVVVAMVAVWALRSGEYPILLGMVIGGGLGNLTDRLLRPPGLLRGYVVDFIDLSFWPTFNVADAAISIGVVILVARGWFGKR